MFYQFGHEEIYLTPSDIKELFFSKISRFDTDYISKSVETRYPNIDRYRNKEGSQTTKRYKIPYFALTINEDGEETLKPAYKPAIGRPYIFKAKEILNPIEYQDFKLNQTETQENTLPF
jgi:hypothetical protein